MIKCICIDDTDRPSKIPEEKWIKKGEEYNVIFTLTVFPQKQLAFQLAEIELDERHLPYEFFLAKRFAFHMEDLIELQKLIKDCSETDFSISELLKQTELEETPTK
jgi:hypothetical protein